MRRTALLAALAVLFAVLVGLGTWQVARLSWKLDLIARVGQRLAAAPETAPGPRDWKAIGKADEYRRMRARGRFDHERETCTQAVTVRGPGCWVITPLQTVDGWWLLVNRGFVEPARRDPALRAQGQIEGLVELGGLLRLSEPGGGFLRANDPARNRWTSRDVALIASARDLPAAAVAPYFIDAATTVPGGPVGGLTVVRFRNPHLTYALTWFALAAMSAAAFVWLLRNQPRDDGA